MAALKRRPTGARYCVSTVGSSAMVMDATVQFSYRMETNRENLSTDERDLALSYLRDGILESLVNTHCPRYERSMPASSLSSTGGLRRHLELEVLSLHSSTAQEASAEDHSDCRLTTVDSKSCNTFSNDLMLLLDSLNMEEGGTPDLLKAKVLSTIQDYMEQDIYTDLVNHKLADEGSDLLVTAFSYVADRPEELEQLPASIPATSNQEKQPSLQESATILPNVPKVEDISGPMSLVLDPTNQQKDSLASSPNQSNASNNISSTAPT